MEEIVRKIAAGVATAPEQREAGKAGTQEIRIHVSAESLGKMKKRAVVKSARPENSTWEILCDEGKRIGGDDSAPPPLAYYSAGIAF
jgi:hypothetical protein